MTRLEARKLTLTYGDRPVIDALDIKILDGRITTIVGANASGKSTLLRGLARLLRPSGGAVLLDGRRLDELSTLEVARTLGVLPQSPIAPDGITVADLVGRGRHPHQGWFRRWGPEDTRAVAHALEVTNTTELTGRTLGELSGGQRQRVWIAMALAQQTDVLLLDEPTTFLDVNHQVELLRLLRTLNAESGKTILVVMHELNLAARYCDHMIAMAGGAVVAEGPPTDVVTAELVLKVFGLESVVVADPVAGTPLVVPA